MWRTKMVVSKCQLFDLKQCYVRCQNLIGPYASTNSTFSLTGPCRTGLKIATDMVANATNIFSLASKNSGLVTKVATRF